MERLSVRVSQSKQRLNSYKRVLALHRDRLTEYDRCVAVLKRIDKEQGRETEDYTMYQKIKRDGESEAKQTEEKRNKKKGGRTMKNNVKILSGKGNEWSEAAASIMDTLAEWLSCSGISKEELIKRIEHPSFRVDFSDTEQKKRSVSLRQGRGDRRAFLLGS